MREQQTPLTPIGAVATFVRAVSKGPVCAVRPTGTFQSRTNKQHAAEAIVQA